MKRELYIRRKKHDTWHFFPQCSYYIMLIKTPSNYGGTDVKTTKPKSGELCDRCLTMEKRFDKLNKK